MTNMTKTRQHDMMIQAVSPAY